MQDYKIINISTIIDERGAISFVEIDKIIDFAIKRVYWLYDFKKARGGHAHKHLKQFMFCLGGAIDVTLDNGITKKIIKLDSPSKGLYLKSGLWREIINVQHNPQLVVLASDVYNELDYIRSYQEFKIWKSSF